LATIIYYTLIFKQPFISYLSIKKNILILKIQIRKWIISNYKLQNFIMKEKYNKIECWFYNKQIKVL
jgi:hypothetical protein